MDPPPSSLRVDLDPDVEDDTGDWELLLPSCIAHQPRTQTATTTIPPPPPPTEQSRQPANTFETVPVVGLGGSALSVSVSQEQQQHHHYPNHHQDNGTLDCCSSLLGAVVMPGWKDDYLSALLEAERDSPVNLELVDACSQLNDRIALLEAERAQAAHQPLNNTTSASSHSLNQPQPLEQPSSLPTTTTTTTPAPTDPTDPLVLRLRADLAHALRQNTDLSTRLRTTTTERDRLLSQTKHQAKTLAVLTAERDSLARRVRDQAEELRGKKQLYDQVQDEVIALEMQLNVAEQQKTQIAAENKNLIDRWMKRAELEATQMNALNERKM